MKAVGIPFQKRLHGGGKLFLIALLPPVLFFALPGCSHTPKAMPEPRAEIKFDLLDFETGTLVGEGIEQLRRVRSAAHCHLLDGGTLCYVIEEDGYRSLKKFIVDLEEDLRACRRRE